jgi:predicted ribosomally synthesized peptide with SipW-like signal peptide
MKKKTLKVAVLAVLAMTVMFATAFAASGSGAYFNDSDEIPDNSIVVGTLDISTNPTSGLIAVSNIAPGWAYHDASHWGYDGGGRKDIRIQNNGTLAVKYRMKAVAVGGNYNDHLLDEMLCSVNLEVGDGSGIRTIFNGSLKDLFNWHVIEDNFGTTGYSGNWYGTGQNIRIGMAIPTSVGNDIEGQDIKFKLVFEATQVDNPAY